MNFLCHLYLSGDDRMLLTGNLMGDFVKGRLEGRYPEPLRNGLILHRRIDSFAHHDSSYQQSRKRIAAQYSLFRGVLVDLFYDHFLVREWGLWSDEPLDHYLGRVRQQVEQQWQLLPPTLQGFLPIIFTELIPSYEEVGGVATALDRMSRRVKRPNPLRGGEVELVNNYEGLRDDFLAFMPKALQFVAEFTAAAE
ncbi:acyl carrier protein phosphodiesterase [Geobacter sp. OR-1]|uniref:acyl carrier protein phosphodiesterase n=1 Tax=Geobacter sp. OR-1 TaxID=1266765 RepID=UPI0005437B2F|nr:ACP phosphodiesterase [Geobacter sp. OR-1]GAM10744.1 acyl carrier protein phosphodiesterase [Geobacter sp. OR-1]